MTSPSRSFLSSKRKPVISCFAFGAALATSLLVSSFEEANAQQRNVKRINNIIHELTPGGRDYYGRPKYRRKISKIVVPYAHGSSGYGYRAGKRRKYRSVVVNYNHSVDLSVFFEKNSARIVRQAMDVLDDLGHALSSRRLRNSVYLLAGHTDSTGKTGYNQWLSEQRARAVKGYLIRNFYIHPNRLIATGFGEERLLDRTHPRSSINRRVEISLIERDYRKEPETSYRLPYSDYTPPETAYESHTTGARASKGHGSGNWDDPSKILCLKGSGIRKDPRPANPGLDDYNTRTPAACAQEEYHPRDVELDEFTYERKLHQDSGLSGRDNREHNRIIQEGR